MRHNTKRTTMKILLLVLGLLFSTSVSISAQSNVAKKEQALHLKKEAKKDRAQIKRQVKRARLERKVSAKMNRKKVVLQAKRKKKLVKRAAISARG